MPYIETEDAGQVYYEEFGSGTALLFVPAGFGDHSSWEHQVAVLSHTHRTITFDWPGTGNSERRNIRYTSDVVVNTIRNLISQLQLEKVTLVAHGIGVHCAILAAESDPELIDRLVLTAGGPWYGGDRDGLIGGFSSEFTSWWGDKMSSTTTLVPDAYAALAREYLFLEKPSPDVVSWFVAGALKWPLVVFNSYNTEMADIDHRERLPKLQQPTLVVQGRHDLKQRYEGAQILADLMPQAELITYENSAHMVNLEEMQRYNTMISEFAV